MKILIAEDEGPKLDHLVEFVSDTFECDVLSARSVRAAIDLIEETAPTLVLLDMSLPTFDIDAGEPGGRPRGSGGSEVMRFIEYLDIRTQVIVVTQYEAITIGSTEVDLAQLATELTRDHPEMFRGIVRYTGMNDEWHTPLRELISEALSI